MIEVKLALQGPKGQVVIKGSSFLEVLNEYERNRIQIDETLGGISFVLPGRKVPPSSSAADTIQGRILFLAQNGFFTISRTANEVREELKQKGYSYPIDRVSIALVRLVRKRDLRRLTEKREGKEVYIYVNP